MYLLADTTASDLKRVSGWTQFKCAKETGMSLRQWQYLECGEKDPSYMETLAITLVAIHAQSPRKLNRLIGALKKRL